MAELYGETLLAGARAGTYVIESLVAAGGWGAVYRARHHLLARLAAIKVLHAELATSPAAVERFFREAQLANQIHHPNLVDVFELGRLPGGRPFLVMELLRGEDLHARIRARGRLATGEALAILDPLARALDALHAERIVHRDVKASNVFLAEADGGERVVLLDLGIAKLLDAPGPSLTTARRVVGSPSCMAPEQILGRPVDHRADLYALGTLAFHMLCGVEPFCDGERTDASILMERHLSADRPQVSRRVSRAAALDPVIAQAMSLQPAERFASAAEFVTALRRAALGAPAGDELAVGIFVDVQLDDASGESLEALHALLAALALPITGAGFEEAAQVGASRLFVAELGASTAAEACARASRIAGELETIVAARCPGDVRIAVHLHLAEGAQLRALGQWAPDASPSGIAQTERFARALD